jgi:hypothetical protein
LNSKLLALLTVVGTIGSIAIYSVLPGTTRQDIIDNATGCNVIVASCEGQLPDGSYDVRKFRALLCRNDAGTPVGVVLPPHLASNLNIFNPNNCHRVGAGCTDPTICTPDDGGTVPEVPDAPACACSSGANCSAPLDDGGTGPAPLGVTLQPGWSGTGCVPKVCTELAGFSSWPPTCPGGS